MSVDIQKSYIYTPKALNSRCKDQGEEKEFKNTTT